MAFGFPKIFSGGGGDPVGKADSASPKQGAGTSLPVVAKNEEPKKQLSWQEQGLANPTAKPGVDRELIAKLAEFRPRYPGNPLAASLEARAALGRPMSDQEKATLELLRSTRDELAQSDVA